MGLRKALPHFDRASRGHFRPHALPTILALLPNGLPLTAPSSTTLPFSEEFYYPALKSGTHLLVYPEGDHEALIKEVRVLTVCDT